MKNIFLPLLLLVSAFCFAQKADKLIKEEDVTRIIKTLSADELKTSLEEAIKTEDYEKASVIRDEINRRGKKA